MKLSSRLLATFAKAKLLLRELKTVKADLAFAKIRSSQLKKKTRSSEKDGKRVTAADDDMIRLQLEMLLAEKARLAHENATCARENLFLREIVEYHQLTIQDVVYLDEGIEEVTEVYPVHPTMASMLAMPPTSPMSPTSPVEILRLANTTNKGGILHLPPVPEGGKDPSSNEVSATKSSSSSLPKVHGDKRPPPP